MLGKGVGFLVEVNVSARKYELNARIRTGVVGEQFFERFDLFLSGFDERLVEWVLARARAARKAPNARLCSWSSNDVSWKGRSLITVLFSRARPQGYWLVSTALLGVRSWWGLTGQWCPGPALVVQVGLPTSTGTTLFF